MKFSIEVVASATSKAENFRLKAQPRQLEAPLTREKAPTDQTQAVAIQQQVFWYLVFKCHLPEELGEGRVAVVRPKKQKCKG